MAKIKIIKDGAGEQIFPVTIQEAIINKDTKKNLVHDLSLKADITYVDGKVKTNVPEDALFTDTILVHSVNNKIGDVKLDVPDIEGLSGKSIILGEDAGKNITTGDWNVLIGNRAGESLTTQEHVLAIGNRAGTNNTAGFFVAIGAHAAYNNTTGYGFTAIGNDAGRNNTTGYGWIAIGGASGKENITGSRWTAIGGQAGEKNTSGNDWTAIGFDSGKENLTGIAWTAVGTSTGYYATGSFWTGVGLQAGRYNTSNEWVAIGFKAGENIANGTSPATSASNSVHIGSRAKVSANGVTNEIAIGYGVLGGGSNTVTLGNSDIEKTILKGEVHASSYKINGEDLKQNILTDAKNYTNELKSNVIDLEEALAFTLNEHNERLNKVVNNTTDQDNIQGNKKFTGNITTKNLIIKTHEHTGVISTQNITAPRSYTLPDYDGLLITRENLPTGGNGITNYNTLHDIFDLGGEITSNVNFYDNTNTYLIRNFGVDMSYFKSSISETSCPIVKLSRHNSNFNVDSPFFVASNDYLGVISASAYKDSEYNNTPNGSVDNPELASSGAIIFQATEDITSEAQGTSVHINATANGSNEIHNVATFSGEGGGRVGIGTKYPTETLDVNGNVKVSGHFEMTSYSEKLITTTGAINLNLGNVFHRNATTNTTFSITGAKSGVAHSFTLIITMGATVRTLSFPVSVKWQGGEIPDMTEANTTYILTFMTINGGTTWFGMEGGAF